MNPAMESATGPLRLHEVNVPADWVDYNGHMNDSRYMQLSSETGDVFLHLIGMDGAYLASGRSFFTVESHLVYISQAYAGDHLYVTVQLLAHDQKRLRIFTSIHRAADDTLVATAEHMMLHVDTAVGKASPAGAEVLASLDGIARHHSQLPLPAQAGRSIGQPP